MGRHGTSGSAAGPPAGEPDVLSFLELALEKSGFRAVTAPNGTEGLIRAHVEQPDLILLDIMMEEMDGWETLRLLKLDETSREIPVIILSARSEPKDKIRALQEGAVDYNGQGFFFARPAAAAAAGRVHFPEPRTRCAG